jgi:hypothetical protein
MGFVMVGMYGLMRCDMMRRNAIKNWTRWESKCPGEGLNSDLSGLAGMIRRGRQLLSLDGYRRCDFLGGGLERIVVEIRSWRSVSQATSQSVAFGTSDAV